MVRPFGHFQPVELLFDLMEGVVADLVAVTHRQDGLPCRLQGSTM